MNRLLVLVLITCSLSVWGGCGTNLFIHGGLNSQTVAGTVTTAEISLITDGGLTVTVTLVTFMQDGNTSSVNFCGDQSSQFLPGNFVEASFIPGQPCANVLQIIINNP